LPPNTLALTATRRLSSVQWLARSWQLRNYHHHTAHQAHQRNYKPHPLIHTSYTTPLLPRTAPTASVQLRCESSGIGVWNNNAEAIDKRIWEFFQSQLCNECFEEAYGSRSILPEFLHFARQANDILPSNVRQILEDSKSSVEGTQYTSCVVQRGRQY
jgi:hypothetical protein